YLELIALEAGGDPQMIARHPWARYLQMDAGPCAWALRTNDLAAESARLRAAGVSVSSPQRSGRQRPDGVRLDWETVQVGTEPNGAFFPFLIHDFTPRKQRAFVRGKPTTKDFAGVKRVVIAVKNLDDAVKRYQTAYGLPQPIRQVDADFGARLALLGQAPVVFATPLNAQSWLARRIEESGEGPCAFVLQARRAGRYQSALKSRWFGIDISWFDTAKLGWHLGFE